MIQGYGKGKSHFAVAVANYFAQPGDSPEIQGILHQVENAVADRNPGLVEGLRAYRDRRHLVICVSGDRGGDLRKHFLQATLHALEKAEVPDAAATNICEPPRRYLESLSPEQVEQANDWLEQHNAPGGDVPGILDLLRNADTSAIRTVRNLSREFNNGFPIDFQDSIDIEKILTDLIDNLCRGDDPRFQGILILFDELHYYLGTWIESEEAAGGTALQNITNVCKNNPSKIALLSFTQFDPSLSVDVKATAKGRYEKLSSRLQDCKYTPVSSLELVLDSLIREKPAPWQAFLKDWGDTLHAEACTTYESHLKAYYDRGWPFDKFHEHLARGCFPLHPITSGLLANLSFTQDRGVIQFLHSHLIPFLDTHEIESNGQLNYLYPVELVDVFIKIPDDSIHRRSFAQLGNTDNPDELTVAKALFLYHHSEGRLSKRDIQNHEDILEALTGISRIRLNAALKSLEHNRQLIYYQKATKTYAFFEGINPNELEKAINKEFGESVTQLKTGELFSRLVQYCQSRVSQYLKNDRLAAEPFISTRQLVHGDWQFERRFYSVGNLQFKLQSDTELKSLASRGLLACVLAAEQTELQELRQTIAAKLVKSPLKDQLVVAIPTEEVGPLSELLYKIQLLERKDTGDRRLWGEAYVQLLKRWRTGLDTTLKRIVQPENCTHHCRVQAKVPPQEQHNPARYVSALLTDLYPFVPPVFGMSQMRSGHNTGSTVTGFIARQLFAGELPTILPDRSYQTILDQVFCSTWHIFRKTTDFYRFQEPQHETIRAAWEELSRLAAFDGQSERAIPLAKIWQRLNGPPYGYNEYTFTVLLAAWLAYHRREVMLRGPNKIKLKRKEKATICTYALPEWAKTDILKKPNDFIREWMLTQKASLIRRQRSVLPSPPQFPASFPDAQAHLEALNRFLALGPNETEATERLDAEASRDEIAVEIKKIRAWFAPVEAATALPKPAPLAELLAVYPTLQTKPPAIEMRSEVISVRPSPEQRDRQTAAQTDLLNRIRASIRQLSERSDSLPDLEVCNAYLEELQVAIAQVTAAPNLPNDLADSLHYARQVAQRRHTDILRAGQIEQTLTQIRQAAKLPNYFTQQDYTDAYQRIATLSANIPADSTAASEVRKIRQDLDLDYRELLEQVDSWESQADSTASKEQILELIKTITNQCQRYTEPGESDRLARLQAQLKEDLIERPDDPPTEPNTDRLQKILDIAQQKIQRIRDLPFGKLPEIFKVYQELADLRLPEIGNPELAHSYREKLAARQADGRSLLAQRFEQICGRTLSNRVECDTQQQRLESARDLVADSGFADLRDPIEQALEALQVRRTEIVRRDLQSKHDTGDKQLMQAIRAYKSNKLNTWQLCEEAIAEIEKYRAKLHNPDAYHEEIAALQQDLQAKLISYQRQLQDLRERLASAANLSDLDQLQRDYNRRAFVFQGSSHQEAYQALSEPLQHRQADLKTLADLAARGQQSRRMAHCQALLGLLEQSPLHDRDRCQNDLEQIRQQLANQQQAFEQKLVEFEQQLDHVTHTRSAQKLQKTVLKHEDCYKDSPLAERFQALSTDLDRILALYQIQENTAPTTLEKCRELRDRLTRWRSALPDCSPDLEDIYAAKLEEIDTTYQQLYAQKQQAADAWVKARGQEAAHIYRTSNDQEKLAIATVLLRTTRQQQSQHQDYLTEELKGTIERIIELCEEEIRKDRANQIRFLFRQLPRVQREQLYHELKQYLGKTTEVSDG